MKEAIKTMNIKVTLTNGKVQIFEQYDNGRVYVKDSSGYWDNNEFDAALAKMRESGAEVLMSPTEF